MIITEVWVPGNPRTKGSLTAKGGYAKDTVQSSRWRALMAEQVRRDIEHRFESPQHRYAMPWPGPVDVELVAFLAVPSTVLDIVETPAIWHNAGDVDKLARNVLDAIAADAKSAIMNGGAIVNDSQVIRLVAEKYAARPGEHGLWLRVTSVKQTELGRRASFRWDAVIDIRHAAVR